MLLLFLKIPPGYVDEILTQIAHQASYGEPKKKLQQGWSDDSKAKGPLELHTSFKEGRT